MCFDSGQPLTEIIVSEDTFESQKLSPSFPTASKQLQIRAEYNMTSGIYSYSRSSSVPGSLLQLSSSFSPQLRPVLSPHTTLCNAL